MTLVQLTNTPLKKPTVSFDKTIALINYKVDRYTFNSESIQDYDKENSPLVVDELNPRMKIGLSNISNIDLAQQIKKTGQITDAIGRYVLDANQNIQFDKKGTPLISIIDGSRRFDSCISEYQDFTIIVGYFDDFTTEQIIRSSFDSQQDLSCLELGLRIAKLESEKGKKISNKDLEVLLDYTKSHWVIGTAKKALDIFQQYPSLIKIFPVINFVGKATINKLRKLIDFALDQLTIEDLITFSKSEAFEYSTEEAVLSAEDLSNFDAKKNSIIIQALSERIGYTDTKLAPPPSIEVNKFVTMTVKPNKKPHKKTSHLTIIDAEITDEERVLVERMLKVLTNPSLKNEMKDVDLNESFEVFLRSFE